MISSHTFRLSLVSLSIFIAMLMSGCGGSSGKDAGASAVEKHVVAAEEFGVALADIQTKADLEKAKPQLLKQAKALAESLAAVNKAVLDNASLGEADKLAAVAPYQMRLAEAERLWRTEIQRIITLDPTFGNELRGIAAQAR